MLRDIIGSFQSPDTQLAIRETTCPPGCHPTTEGFEMPDEAGAAVSTKMDRSTRHEEKHLFSCYGYGYTRFALCSRPPACYWAAFVVICNCHAVLSAYESSDDYVGGSNTISRFA